MVFGLNIGVVQAHHMQKNEIITVDIGERRKTAGESIL
jgi:hypothetical protein